MQYNVDKRMVGSKNTLPTLPKMLKDLCVPTYTLDVQVFGFLGNHKGLPLQTMANGAILCCRGNPLWLLKNPKT